MKVSSDKVMQALKTQHEEQKRMQIKADIRGLDTIQNMNPKRNSLK